MNNTNQSLQFYQVDSHHFSVEKSEIITETPVSLTVNGEIWLSFMCTPVHLEAMAVGFLYNEGLINKIDEIASIRVCATGDNIDIWLNKSVEKPEKWLRTSGCTGGVTSVEVHETDTPQKLKVNNGFTLPAEMIGILIDQLFDSQDLYRKSGGVHTSALSDGQKITIIAEDIGRHNTLDKIAGLCLLECISQSRRILITTGRISSEMVQKAARIGASIVISRTSPSSLSIQMANQFGMTLIGYARRSSFRLYTHPEKILFKGTQIPDVLSEQLPNSRVIEPIKKE